MTKLLNIGAEVTLVVVSKTQDCDAILKVYQTGQRDFGENRVQELVEKQAKLPSDIKWHLIGHLQKNKIKYIAEFVHLIHSVDSIDLLESINKAATKVGRNIDVLFQLKIAREESKYGLSFEESDKLIQLYFKNNFPNIDLKGFMGMASFSPDVDQVQGEFRILKEYRDLCIERYGEEHFRILSMGMSNDYSIAIQEGATMIRVGSLIFRARS